MVAPSRGTTERGGGGKVCGGGAEEGVTTLGAGGRLGVGRRPAAAVQRGGPQHVRLGGERAVERDEGGGGIEAAETGRDREREVGRVGGGEVRSRRIQQAKDVAVDTVLGDPRSGTLIERAVHVYRGAELGACLDYVKERQRFVRIRETARRRPLPIGEAVGARQTDVVFES